MDLTFENLQKWTPVALSLGDRGLSPDHRATGPLSPSGRATGCFLQNLHGQKHRNVAERSSEGPVARPMDDRTLSPGHWATGPPVAHLSPGGRATGPLPPIKCVCPPRKVIWSQKFSEKRERGRKSEATKPCWILGLRSLGNCLAHVLDQYVLHYYIIVLRSIFTIFD